MSAARSITAFHLVSGFISARWSSSVSVKRPREETEMSVLIASTGNRGLVRLDQAGQDVGRAAAGRPFAHADLAGDARIAVGHIGGVALVARQDVRHAVVEPVERVVERQAGVAAQAEDVPHAVQLQHRTNASAPVG